MTVLKKKKKKKRRSHIIESQVCVSACPYCAYIALNIFFKANVCNFFLLIIKNATLDVSVSSMIIASSRLDCRIYDLFTLLLLFFFFFFHRPSIYQSKTVIYLCNLYVISQCSVFCAMYTFQCVTVKFFFIPIFMPDRAFFICQEVRRISMRSVLYIVFTLLLEAFVYIYMKIFDEI